MPVGVGLELGADSVKLVQVRTGPAGVQILSAVRVSRQGGEFPAEAIARAVRRAGLRRRVTVGVAGKDLMLRYMPVPAVPPWRLKMLVEFEIRENMSGGAEVASDYRPLRLPTGLEGGLLVLAAVAKTSYLDEVFRLVRSAGLSVNAAVPCAVALHRGFAASREFKAGETTFLLDIGRENVEMAIQRDGDIYFARNMTGSGGERITQGIDEAFGIGRDRAEAYKRERSRLSLGPPEDADKRQQLVYNALREAADAVVGAVSSGLRFARMQTKLANLDFDRLVLSGGGARLSGLKEFLENRLQKPVTLYDPSAALDSSALRGEAAACFGGAPSEMAVAAGLAIADAEREGFALSLLPPRERARREFWRTSAFGYAAALVCAVLAGAMFLRARTDLGASRSARETLEKEMVGLRARADAVERLEKEIRSRRDDLALLLDEARVNRALLELLPLQRSSCPEGLNLSRMELVPAEPGGDVTVDFEGHAANLDDRSFLARLEEFRAALSANPCVRSAAISEAPLKGQEGQEGLRAFKCRVTLSPWASAAGGGTVAPAGGGAEGEAPPRSGPKGLEGAR